MLPLLLIPEVAGLARAQVQPAATNAAAAAALGFTAAFMDLFL